MHAHAHAPTFDLCRNNVFRDSVIWCFSECVCLFIMRAPLDSLFTAGIQSVVRVRAHTQAHTSIWVSGVCVPGLWKCQISGLEGRGPPVGDKEAGGDGGIWMVPLWGVPTQYAPPLSFHCLTVRLLHPLCFCFSFFSYLPSSSIFLLSSAPSPPLFSLFLFQRSHSLYRQTEYLARFRVSWSCSHGDARVQSAPLDSP